MPSTEVKEPVTQPEQPVFDWRKITHELFQKLVINSVIAVPVSAIVTAIVSQFIPGMGLAQLLLAGFGVAMIIVAILIFPFCIALLLGSRK